MARTHTFTILALIIVLASSAAILIRFAEIPASSIGFWRVLGAACILSPWCLRTWRKEGMPPLLTLGALLAGAALGFHFATWSWALHNTTVANAALFVGLTPLIVPCVSHLIHREHFTSGERIGAVLAVFGLVWIVGWQFTFDISHLPGSLVALFSAFWCALYFVVSRKYRARQHIILFSWMVYIVAACVQAMTAYLLDGGLFLGDRQTHIALIALIIFPTIGGHTLVMYLLRHAKSHLLALCIPVEFVVVTLMAMAFFAEFPSLSFYAGALLILAGLFIAIGWRVQEPDNTQMPAANVID